MEITAAKGTAFSGAPVDGTASVSDDLMVAALEPPAVEEEEARARKRPRRAAAAAALDYISLSLQVGTVFCSINTANYCSLNIK